MNKRRVMAFSVMFAFMLMVSVIFSGQSIAETSNKELIKKIVSLAEEGKVLNCPFGIGSKKDDVIDKFGKPDKEEKGEKGGTLFYTKSKGLILYYSNNEEEQATIDFIQKTSKAIRTLTYKELKKEIKNLEAVVEQGFVKVGDYLLVLDFEAKAKDPKNPHLKRVSLTQGPFE